MTLHDLIHGELIDLIEWLDESPNAMAWRFDRPDNEIKNGAQLIVRPGQVAVFVDQGTVADVFQPGRHTLATQNLPVLSKLRGCKYGFESPFKAEVIFVSTRQFANQKWGTKTPIMMTDRELGGVRLRAYGTYISQVRDAETFVSQVVGANASYALEQIADQVRDLIVAHFAQALGSESVSILKLASRYGELGARTLRELQPDLMRLGLEVSQLVVESIALPDEVAATLDQRTRLGLIGDVGAYAALQAADALRDAARNAGAAGTGAAIGVGIGMAGQMAQALGAAVQASSGTAAAAATAVRGGTPRVAPPPVPQSAAFYIAVGGEPQGPLDLAALDARIAEGKLTRDTLVWREGMSAWAPAGQVPEVAARLRPL